MTRLRDLDSAWFERERFARSDGPNPLYLTLLEHAVVALRELEEREGRVYLAAGFARWALDAEIGGGS